MKTMKELTSQIKKDIHSINKFNKFVIRKRNNRDRHSPEAANKILRAALGISKHYADYLGISQEEVLTKLEEMRTSGKYSNWSPNFYNRSNWPRITQADIFNTREDFFKRFPSKKYICPACGGESNDPSVCDTGKEMSPDKICDWKAYGLFGCLGKGYVFIIKEEFKENFRSKVIFKPKELN